MTHDKAREYFSAFHEGTLEPGLRSSLERKLSGELALRSEYDAFVATVAALDALRSEAIETPSYLSDRIASRIDSARVAPAPFWAAWFAPRPANASSNPRFIWATGLAACLLLGAIGLRGMRSDDSVRASVVSGEGSESVKWDQDSNGVTAKFAGGSARKVTVTPAGGTVQLFSVAARQPLEITLSNPNAFSRRFTLKSDDNIVGTVSVPGSRASARHAGSGSLEELAAALSDAFRIAVVVKGETTGTTFRWNLAGPDARAAAEKSLGGQANAVMMDGNVLQIGQ